MSSVSLIKSVVKIDGNYYGVVQGTFVRTWTRSFSSNLAANIIRLNFVDRGPGIRVYNFQIMAYNWATTSLPYIEGCTQNFDAQRTGLEASYSKIATPFEFLDPFNEPPTFGGTLTSGVSGGSTSFQIDPSLASLISSSPTALGTYPYTMYLWAKGSSLGAGLAGMSTIDAVSVYAVSGTTVSCSATSHSWSTGDNVAIKLGVYMTNLNQTEVNDMSSSSPRVLYSVELTEATQVVA